MTKTNTPQAPQSRCRLPGAEPVKTNRVEHSRLHAAPDKSRTAQPPPQTETGGQTRLRLGLDSGPDSTTTHTRSSSEKDTLPGWTRLERRRLRFTCGRGNLGTSMMGVEAGEDLAGSLRPGLKRKGGTQRLASKITFLEPTSPHRSGLRGLNMVEGRTHGAASLEQSRGRGDE